MHVETERPIRAAFPVNIGATERTLTAGFGGALLLLGISRGRAAGATMATIGAALVARAVGGHCPAYAMMERRHFPEAPETRRMMHDPVPHERRDLDRAEVLGGPHPDAMPGGDRSTPAEDDVEMASELSFPASDPPAYNPQKPT